MLLEPTGTTGKYSTYEIEGNDFTLSLDVAGVRHTANRIIAIGFVIFALFLILIIVGIVYIKKSGKHVPRLLRRFVKKVSRKIESKEQIFYDESKELEQKDDNPEPFEIAGDSDGKSADSVGKGGKPVNSVGKGGKPVNSVGKAGKSKESDVVDENGVIDLDAEDYDADDDDRR